MKRDPKSLIRTSLETIREIQILSGKDLNQQERISLIRFKRKLASLKEELKIYLSPVIWEIHFTLCNSLGSNDVKSQDVVEYLANVPQEIIPDVLALMYPEADKLKILEIRKLG